MKRRAIVTINGETFELENSNKFEPHEYTRKYTNPTEIFEHYRMPSKAKALIWESWVTWARDLINEGNDAWLTISAAGSMHFSIKGECLFNGGHYALWITKCHNRAFRIS